MGGKALSINLNKMSREDYENFLSFLMPKLKEKLPKNTFLNIPYYFDKKSFSDVDIIVSDENNIREKIIEFFVQEGSKKHVQRKDMLFFELNGVQIDIMIYKKESIYFARDFYSYNDLVSLFVKKVCSSKNLILLPDGLFYRRKNDKSQHQKVLITNNFDEVLSFMDFDVEKFRLGFKSKYDMYAFIIKSKHFSRWKFNKDYFKKIDTISYKNRVIFKAIIDMINSKEKAPEKLPSLLNDAIENFPLFKEKLQEIEKSEKRIKKVKRYFNGNTIKEETGYNKIEIGNFIAFIRDQVDGDIYLHLEDLGKEEIVLFISEMKIKYER